MNPEAQTPPQKPRLPRQKFNGIAFWLPVGVALGAGIGVAMNNLAVGIGAGIAIGVGIGAATEARKKQQ